MTSFGSLRWTVDGASPQFLDRVVDISVMLRDMYAQCSTVLFWILTCPLLCMSRSSTTLSWCRGRFPWSRQQTTEIPQLQYIDQVLVVLVVQVQQIRAMSWETVEIPQLQLEFSWTGCCSPVVCNNRCLWWLSQFIDSYGRPCDHAR